MGGITMSNSCVPVAHETNINRKRTTKTKTNHENTNKEKEEKKKEYQPLLVLDRTMYQDWFSHAMHP